MFKVQKILSLLFAALLAKCSASTGFFAHTHVDEYGRVYVHSHPYSHAGHTHGEGNTQIADTLAGLLQICCTVVACVTMLIAFRVTFFSVRKGYAQSVLAPFSSPRVVFAMA